MKLGSLQVRRRRRQSVGNTTDAGPHPEARLLYARLGLILRSAFFTRVSGLIRRSAFFTRVSKDGSRVAMVRDGATAPPHHEDRSRRRSRTKKWRGGRAIVGPKPVQEDISRACRYRCRRGGPSAAR